MQNYLLFTVSIYVELGLLTKEDGEKLAKELETITLPDRFSEARTLVHSIFERLEIKPAKLPK